MVFSENNEINPEINNRNVTGKILHLEIKQQTPT